MAETKIAAKLATITPEQAEALLQRNTHNRAPARARVLQYAADLAKGDWQVNGEAIKVSSDGQILDGQHRLLAIVEAGVSMTTLLITGLPPETQETMDQGKARSFGDMLKLRGEKDYFNLAAAVRMVYFFERDGTPFASFGKPSPSAQQLARTLARNSEIRESVALAGRVKRLWLSQSALAGMHYLLSIADAQDADTFVAQLTSGEGLSASSPIYVLRERLIKEHYEQGGVHVRVKLAFIVKAWNAWRRGEPMQRLQWAAGGTSPDKFPKIDGLASKADDADVA